MRCWILAAVVGAACGLAAGQDGQPRDPMAGPEVRERRIPGVEQGFSETSQRRARRESMVPHRVFMQAIDALRGRGEHPAPEAIRLTDDQDEAIEELDREFRERAREQLQQAGGDRERRREQEPEGAAPSGDPGARRARAAERMRDGPRPADWHTRMFAELNEQQRGFVNERIAVWRKQADERFGEEYAERRLKQRQAGAAGAREPGEAAGPPRGPGPGGPGAPSPQRERFRRVAERLAQLPPEERERILARLEAELDRREAEGPRDGRPGDERPVERRRPRADRPPQDRPSPPAGEPGRRPPPPPPGR